jgi:hypothetical protein
MRKLFLGAPLVVLAAGTLTSCQTTGQRAAAPLPESEQIISNRIKDLYMAASAAPQRSAEQRKLILRMADKSSNGKELMLTMRAAAGVFATGADDAIEPAVTAKMMQVGTLDQLSDYAKEYPVSSERARPYVQRMFQLGESQTDPRVWQRIRAAAARLKLPDLERQAQDKADQLAAR